MLVLLSPAKKIKEDIDLKANKNYTSFRLTDKVETLLKNMKMKTAPDLMELMSISEKLANLNQGRYEQLNLPIDEDNGLPAIEMFKGDVYMGLDIESLSNEDQDFAQAHLRILSGLYGLLRPYDLVAPYRLEMGTKLATKQAKNLYGFWGDNITNLVNEDAKEHDFIINLASNEYFKSINKKKLQKPLITIHFKEERNGKLKIISFSAKKARGLMARYIIQNKLKQVEELQSFDWENYSFHPEGSSENELLFVR